VTAANIAAAGHLLNSPGLLADWQIRDFCKTTGMVEPFHDRLVDHRAGVISYGLSSHGYDIRLGTEFKRYVSGDFASGPIDPKSVTEADVESFTETGRFVLAPGDSVLACSMEYIRMPDDVLGFVVSKSTYARCFIGVNNTVLEAGWQGIITLELTNMLRRGVYVYPGEGIAQVVFVRGERCDVSYENRLGKYQGQRGVTLPRVGNWA